MRTVVFALFVFAVGLLCSAAANAAVIVSSCSMDNMGAGPGFTCNLYESDNGESSRVVPLPAPVTSGYVVLLESGDPNNTSDQNNIGNWSDVLQFLNADGNAVGNAITVQLLSDGSGLFPSLATVLDHSHAFILETQTGTGNDNTDVTVWDPPPNTYNVYSDAPVNEGDVPEPATLSLLGAGLIGLGAFAKKLRK